MPTYYGTGITGADLEKMSDLDIDRIDSNWPKDEFGSKLSLGNSVAVTMEALPEGVIEPWPGGPEAWDPAVSEKQRRFMGAELRRKRSGKKTRTGMSEKQLRDYAKK